MIYYRHLWRKPYNWVKLLLRTHVIIPQLNISGQSPSLLYVTLLSLSLGLWKMNRTIADILCWPPSWGPSRSSELLVKESEVFSWERIEHIGLCFIFCWHVWHLWGAGSEEGVSAAATVAIHLADHQNKQNLPYLMNSMWYGVHWLSPASLGNGCKICKPPCSTKKPAIIINYVR